MAGKTGARRQPPPAPPTSVPMDAKMKSEFVSNWGQIEQENLSSADYYFNSYAHFGIHEEMIKDSVRTGAYQNAIMSNRHIFENKVVLDVGCGTGVLSMFAARAGAKRVYGVECSDIIDVAEKLVAQNNFSDTIVLIRGKIEEIELPVKEVDIILSEWMGYFLLYESMLDSVIFARDKWLTKTGVLFPDKAKLYVAAIEDREYREEKLEKWRSVYGLDFSYVRKCIIEEPVVDTVSAEAVVTDSYCLLDLDLKTCSVEDLNFVSAFKLTSKRIDFVHALVAWFDVEFSCCHVPVKFSTGPFTHYTHWKQCVFYVEDIMPIFKDEEITGIIAVRKNQKNPRDLDIKLRYLFKNDKLQVSRDQVFRLR